MSPADPNSANSDLAKAQRFLAGDTEALGTLFREYQPLLLGYLVNHGAKTEEAQDIISGIWSGCMGAEVDRNGEPKPPLLEKFSGSSLRAWLRTVALNRLITERRRGAFVQDVTQRSDGEETEDFFTKQPAQDEARQESLLTDWIAESVAYAFSRREPAARLMLRLRYGHGITQRELARLFTTNEARVSRVLDKARKDIGEDIFALLKRKDPLLNLEWNDFLELCDQGHPGFLS